MYAWIWLTMLCIIGALDSISNGKTYLYSVYTGHFSFACWITRGYISRWKFGWNIRDPLEGLAGPAFLCWLPSRLRLVWPSFRHQSIHDLSLTGNCQHHSWKWLGWNKHHCGWMISKDNPPILHEFEDIFRTRWLR